MERWPGLRGTLVRCVSVRWCWCWRASRIMARSGRRSCRLRGKVGVSGESLRRWVRQAEVDAGHRAGMSSADAEALRELRRENRELRRANEILTAAATFFARELDPRLPRS